MGILLRIVAASLCLALVGLVWWAVTAPEACAPGGSSLGGWALLGATVAVLIQSLLLMVLRHDMERADELLLSLRSRMESVLRDLEKKRGGGA